MSGIQCMNNGLNSTTSQSNTYQVTLPRLQKKCSVVFCYEDSNARELLTGQGFLGFDDFWSLPHRFVDDVNYRRGGWSGVSKLYLENCKGSDLYFLKRQENQFRYSLRNPFGRLTFEIEIDAIRRNQRNKLPSVEVACWGVKKSRGSSRALIVTRAINCQSLADIIISQPDWKALLPVLGSCGEQLYRMHALGIRHGALYPNHIFINTQTGAVQLIDFEGARHCRRISKAIQPDLQQLVRRLDGMPAIARDVLLKPYRENHSSLLAEPLRALEAS